MEFGERKRSRKSQSFKLVNRDYHDEDKAAGYSSDVNGEAKHEAPLFGDESMEIKKQITGMRRLLNDSTGRIYQRVGEEGENIKEEPQEVDLVWVKSLNPPSEPRPLPSRPPPSPAWSSPSPPMGHVPGKYGTRSKSNHNLVRPSGGSNGETPTVNSLAGSNCCTCNCQPILIAILQELKAMRQFVQLQAGNQNRQPPSNSCVCAQRSPVARKRNRKRKLPLKLVLPLAFRKPSLSVAEKKPLRIPATSRDSGTESTSPKVENQGSGYGIVQESFSSDPEVQLAEGFDVLMHKSQLDSILTNYTRSGSLLFRKLVCAFFDDKTLANSLPNGKRKRGLNDNRKGLDQNIVGAIKVFTEKYCSANHVDKVPGPRDWVQILQDQIKLARRRLKRGSNSEAGECEEKTEVMSVQETGKPAASPTERTCENSEQEHSP
ncbi:BEN domain-containing protein 7 isoform X2 [Ambystoma mexicanum]|uniref:BEN domain-containing protein 7 isoform X2 n=1 Tax=Ambystoma mexicanum TaxID=8296 RepID=UPI0037E7884B